VHQSDVLAFDMFAYGVIDVADQGGLYHLEFLRREPKPSCRILNNFAVHN